MPAPLAPWSGAPLRVIIASEKPVDGNLTLIAPDGSVAAKADGRHGGPPYYWYADVASPAAGTWRATLTLSGTSAPCPTITRDIVVNAKKPPPLRNVAGTMWPIRNSWNRATENLYSAWIAKMFDAPLDQELSWKAWYDVLRDRSRNMLFDYLGLNEDNVAMSLRPDCADFVYFLRAYFCLQDGIAVRLFELLARHRRPAAQVLPVVQHRTSGADASGAAAGARSRGRSDRRLRRAAAATAAEPVAADVRAAAAATDAGCRTRAAAAA